MKRITYALVPVLVLALAAGAFAQEKPIVSNTADTAKITVSGGIDLDYIYYNGELLEVKSGTPEADTNVIAGHVNVKLNAELTNKIVAVVDLGNYVDAGNGFFGMDPEITGVQILEASVTLNQFLNEALTFKLGVNPYAIHFVPGGSLLFDPRWSDTLVTTTGILPVGATPNELQPTGLVATYKRQDVTLDMIVLPAIAEGGATSDDEAAYGLVFDYANEALGQKGSHAGAALMLFNAGGLKGSQIITFGGGATLIDTWVKNLTLFGELYFQFGQVFDTGGTDEDAAGYAFQIGGKYVFEGEQKPWIQGKITWLTGDDDATDDEENNFLSYETIEDLLILENQYFGINVRSNYWAFKGSGGLSLSVGGEKDNFDLSGILGFATTSEDVPVASGDEDALGIEFDACASYHLNKQTTLDAQVGMLFSSDILEGVTVDEEDSTWVFTLGVKTGF